MTTWHNAIARQTAVMNKLSGGLRARLERQITAGELDSIIAECRDTTRAIERDMEIAWLLGCSSRAAVGQGEASCI